MVKTLSKISPNRSLKERVEFCKKYIWKRYSADSPFYSQAVLSLSYLWCEFDYFQDSVFFEELETFFYPLKNLDYAEKLFSECDFSES